MSRIDNQSSGADEAAGAPPAAPSAVTLSVVIRVAQPSELRPLDETLFSVALQYWRDVELIVVARGEAGEVRDALAEFVGRQPWLAEPQLKIVPVVPPPKANARSVMANAGIERATGRFLVFLESGEVFTQHGPSALVRLLVEGRGVVAQGGHLRQQVGGPSGSPYVRARDSFPWRASRNLFRVRRPPLAATVIDRSRTGDYALRFDESLPSDEDADFLSRLCRDFPPDLSAKGVPVYLYSERLSGFDRAAYEVAARAYGAAGALPRLRDGLRRLLLGARGGER